MKRRRRRGTIAGLGLGLGLGLVSIAPRPGHASTEPTEVPAAPAAEASDEAGSTATVLVLPVRLSGELPADTATEMRALLMANLSDEGEGVLVSRDEVDEAAADCDAQCRRALAQRSGATFLVDAEIVGDEDEFSVTVALIDGETGEVLTPFEDACSICGFVEVRDMVRLRALDARAEMVRRRKAAAVRPAPQPAAPVADAPPPPRSKMVPAGWSLVGGGAATLLGGVVLLAMHHRSAGCLDNPRGGDCVPVRFTTAIPGAVVLGTGLIATAVGVTLVVLGRRAEQRKAEARVAWRPAAGGVALRF